jgi:hypothetical protein
VRALVVTFALIASPALAQPDAIPRTAEGKPDFHGSWLSGFVTPLERPDGLPALAIAPEKQADALKLMIGMVDEGEVYDPEFDSNAVPFAIMKVGGEMRASLVVTPQDGKLPLTALARATLKGFKRGYDNPEARSPVERCVEGGVSAPMTPSFLLVPVQVVQTRDAIAFAMEDVDPLRIVPFDAAPRADTLRTRNGQSRGRWEADTLIVETDHFAISTPAGFSFRGGGALITADSKVIERFSFADADTILYQFTIEDPSLYSAPWLAEYALTRIPRPIYEYACHEGNHALTHILLAARLGKQEGAPPP